MLSCRLFGRAGRLAVGPILNSPFSMRTGAALRQRRQELIAIENPLDMFDEIKKRAAGQKEVNTSNLIHLLKRCTDPANIWVAARGMTYFQRRGVPFSEFECSYFVNLCVQAEKPKIFTDMIAEPGNRLGAWLGKKATSKLYKSLAKTDDIETMLKVAEISRTKGLSVQTMRSVETMMEVAQKTGNADHKAAVLAVAESSRLPVDFLVAFKKRTAAQDAAAAAKVEPAPSATPAKE